VNDMSNNSVYESIMAGLNEALADAQSEKPILKRHKVTVEPVKIFEADEVKKIRNSTGMSQKIFASYMGVSYKTVEAWEAGTNHPSGAASRLLSMIENDKYNPTLELCLNLARSLQTDLNSLFWEDDF